MSMKLEHLTLNDRAYDQIRRSLVIGQLQPGQVLVIRTLAEQFGISATPVRDAMQRLVAERLLVMLPNRSIAVPLLSGDTFVELVRIRSALEGLAGELATPNIRLAELHQLHRLIQEGEAAAAARDMNAYVQMNQAFHFLIYGRAESPLLFQKIHELWSQVGPYLTRLFDSDAYIPVSNDVHRSIVAALEAKDGATVKLQIAHDITSAGEPLLTSLRQTAEPASAPNGFVNLRSQVDA
jgi:DNA-binding GntR family transcriptional regulator